MTKQASAKLKRIEMKFLLDSATSEGVRQWARDHLGVDENCSSECGDRYEISSLYLDTSSFDLFHRSKRVGSSKHRVRRYGNEQTLWLETKRKKKMVVRKSRTAVFESDFLSRCGQSWPDAWSGNWFLERVEKRSLVPAVQIAYQRFARTSTFDNQNMRLTIDSDMRARPIAGWRVGNEGDLQQCEERSFGQHEILELKFCGAMPTIFKQLLRAFSIPSTGFSKYRSAVAALGLGELTHA